MDAGVACTDRDGDGYGQNCAYGRDCNDDDPNSTNECRDCVYPERGCSCNDGQAPISCFLPDKELEGGNVMCSEGSRYCRDGLWSGCEGVHEYVVTPEQGATLLVNPDAAPENCSICDCPPHYREDPGR